MFFGERMASVAQFGLLLILTSMAASQTPNPKISGTAAFLGAAVASSTLATQDVHVYVVFPPASNPLGGRNNENFRNYVMTQDAIDGVTVQINWSAVEQGDYTTTPCTPLNSDTCQKDSAGYYHNYIWAPPTGVVDGTLCMTNSPSAGLGQWFCTTGPPTGWGAKKVNPLIFGVSSNPNISTPHYVTTQQWANDIGASLQDVINKNKDNCGSYSGYSPHDMSQASDATVTVNMSGSVPFSNGDHIWVANAEAKYNVTNQVGTTVQNVSGSSFQYKSDCVSSCADGVAFPVGTIVSSASSWPIPTELPYRVAFRAFVNAAIYHFSHSNGVIEPTQVAYMRVGYARGAEALPECLANWPSYTGNLADSKQAWLNFYADMSTFLMGAATGSAFHMQTPINEAGPGPPFDTDYGTQEAGLSVQYTGGDGKVFGFGAQGLQATDQSGYPNCASNWCRQFEQYWAGGTSYKYTDFELQQIDCSDPTGAATGLACGQNGDISRTGNLANLLPFASGEHMTILELYNQDALLAYDPAFCTPSGASCNSGGTCTGASGDVFPNLDTGHQSQFFQCVGKGEACGGVPGTTGDCSYQAAINAAHGVH